IVVDIQDAMKRSISFEETIRLVFLEARLRGGGGGAAVYFDNFDCLYNSSPAEEKTSYLKDIIAIYLKHFLGITFIAGEKTLRYDEGLFKTLVPVMIEFPQISYRMRRDIW